jgi:hypothetical protein
MGYPEYSKNHIRVPRCAEVVWEKDVVVIGEEDKWPLVHVVS